MTPQRHPRVLFQLLGSVEAHVEDRPVDLGHARQRCVLAALLMDANRLVTVDQLVDRVWAHRPPQRARDTLYGYLSRLRGILDGLNGVEIARRSGGYSLTVELAAIDLYRFRDLLVRARASEPDERTAALLEQAVALWRGDAFAGIDAPWIGVLRETLHGERLSAELDLDDVRLRLGRHVELLAGLSARAQAHPLDERVAGQFILALYRCGRPAAALGHYQRTRSLLVEELGCDPGPALQELHQRILTADPTITSSAIGASIGPATEPTPASAEARQRPSARPPAGQRPRTAGRLIGRAAELRVIDRALEGTRADAPAVVEIIGEPGIGKTRLLAELCERAQQRHLVLLTGQGVEFTQSPYGVFVDALDHHAGAQNSEAAATARGLLGAALPTRSPEHWADAEPAASERYGWHQAVRSCLETLSSDTGLVLALDDLHWADEDSVELIGHLLRHPPGTRLLLALAYRQRQAPPHLPAALARAEAQGRVARIELGALSQAEATQLCGASMSRWRRQQLYEASRGNPFYLEALAKRYDAAVPAEATAAAHEPPRFQHAILLEELEGLPPAARTFAQAAAVLGETFEADMAAVIAQAEEPHIPAILDVLAQHDLIRQVDSARRFSFRHPLVRAAIYHSAGVGWRIEAHARTARELASRGAPLASQAPHTQQSARVGDTHAAQLLVRAADHVMTVAPLAAARWIANALRLLELDGQCDRLRPEWLLKQAEALGMAGRLHESQDILRTTVSLLPAGPRSLRARVTASRATVAWKLGRYEQAVSLLLRELKNADGLPSTDKADLELGVAAVALRTADIPTAIEWGERALRTMEGGGGPIQLTSARGLLALAHTVAGDAARSDHYLTKVLDTVEDNDDDSLAGHIDILAMVGWTEMFRERHASALRHLDRGLKLSRRTGQTSMLADIFAASAYVLTWLGRLDEAAAHVQDALEAASLIGSNEACSLAAAADAAISLWRGDFAGALRTCQRSLAELIPEPSPMRTAITGMLGQSLLLNGDPAGCVRTVIEAGGGHELLRFEAPVRPLWFRTLTTAELARGDVAAAERWARRAASASPPDGPPGRHGFALLAHADVRLARDDPNAAQAGACEAAASFRTARMPLYEATALITAGTALAALDCGSGALTQLDRAGELASACGASGLYELAADARRRTAATTVSQQTPTSG